MRQRHIAVRRHDDDWPQYNLAKGTSAVGFFDHRTFGLILVADHHHARLGTEVEIPEHVAGTQRC